MKHIYCDESRPEMIGKVCPYDDYSIIGGIWIDEDNVRRFKRNLKKIRVKHNYYAEMKWKNVSPSSLEFYKEIVTLFFDKEYISFRCIVIDADKVDLESFHNNDQELGFYKFYYQLIYHWLRGNERYSIFLDYKKNKELDRLHKLKEILNISALADVDNLQALNSKDSIFIQLADILIGSVGYKFNQYSTSTAKLEIINLIEERLTHEIKETMKGEYKFNVFKIRLQ
ncbi:DUF3800 domain-containing protein [Solibacillus ferritrahens]|uniref:DUF3800 domain-containing protein n=1 Tax=Solibacillus ferritrahens TaxID=3098620 RepID=UPI003009B956